MDSRLVVMAAVAAVAAVEMSPTYRQAGMEVATRTERPPQSKLQPTQTSDHTTECVCVHVSVYVLVRETAQQGAKAAQSPNQITGRN